MIKLPILYPNKSGSRVDMNYGVGTPELQADIPRHTAVAPLMQFKDLKLTA